MFCHKCGTKMGENAAFCHKCGTAVRRGEAEQATVNVTPATSGTTLEEVKGEDKFDVVLIKTRIMFMRPIIDLIMEVTGLGEQEAKSLNENPPAVLKKSVSKSEATTLMNKFSNVGSVVEVVPEGVFMDEPIAPSETDEPKKNRLDFNVIILYIIIPLVVLAIVSIIFNLGWGLVASVFYYSIIPFISMKRPLFVQNDEVKFAAVLVETNYAFLSPFLVAIKEVTGLGANESESLIENRPSVLKKSISNSEAEAIKKKFANVGAVVEVHSVDAVAQFYEYKPINHESEQSLREQRHGIFWAYITSIAFVVYAVIIFRWLWLIWLAGVLACNTIVTFLMFYFPNRTPDKQLKLFLRITGAVSVAAVIIGCLLLHLHLMN